MSRRWNRPGIPHRGWTCVGSIDHGEPDFKCQMCGNEWVRYEQIMEHPEFVGTLGVGQVCAGKMTDDYAAAKARDRQMKNRTKRRLHWACSSKWKNAGGGSMRRRERGKTFLIYASTSIQGAWTYLVFAPGLLRVGEPGYPTADLSKLAAFDALWPPDNR